MVDIVPSNKVVENAPPPTTKPGKIKGTVLWLRSIEKKAFEEREEDARYARGYIEEG